MSLPGMEGRYGSMGSPIAIVGLIGSKGSRLFSEGVDFLCAFFFEIEFGFVYALDLSK